MKIHANAPLGPKGRGIMVRRVTEEGWSLTEAAAAAGISDRRCREWVRRYLAEGEAGLYDRSSAPRRVANRTEEARIEAIAALRRLRLTAAEIAEVLQTALSTVSGILRSIGLGKLSSLEPLEPPNRYIKDRPGELIHIDVKKLGRIGHRGAGHRVSGNRGPGQRSRGAGWEFVHVCVDDATRLAYVEVLGDETARSAISFLRRALRFFAAHGVEVEAVMTDNGSAYRSSAERTRALGGWLDFYNRRRRHGSLGHRSPFERLSELQGNNVVGSYN